MPVELLSTLKPLCVGGKRWKHPAWVMLSFFSALYSHHTPHLLQMDFSLEIVFLVYFPSSILPPAPCGHSVHPLLEPWEHSPVCAQGPDGSVKHGLSTGKHPFSELECSQRHWSNPQNHGRIFWCLAEPLKMVYLLHALWRTNTHTSGDRLCLLMSADLARVWLIVAIKVQTQNKNRSANQVRVKTSTNAVEFQVLQSQVGPLHPRWPETLSTFRSKHTLKQK